MSLFVPSNATIPNTGIIKFHYGHTDRKWAVVEVDVNKMLARYISPANNAGPWDGNVLERNGHRLGDFANEHGVHGILFQDFHLLYGWPQSVAFKQHGINCWVGKHRNGDKIIMTMMPAGTDPPNCAAPAAWNAFKVITLPYNMPAGSSQLRAPV